MTKIRNLYRKGQPIWIDEGNHIFPVIASTPFRTHLGRLAAPVQVEPLVGHWGIMFNGQPIAMTFTNVVDAGLLLLELTNTDARRMHDYWSINYKLSERKVVPHGIAIRLGTVRARAGKRGPKSGGQHRHRNKPATKGDRLLPPPDEAEPL